MAINSKWWLVRVVESWFVKYIEFLSKAAASTVYVAMMLNALAI